MAEKRISLARWRKEVKRFTQQELADALGIKYGQYAALEYRPTAKIPSSVLAKLMALGYQPDSDDAPPAGIVELRSEGIGLIPLLGMVSAGTGTLSDHQDKLIQVPVRFARPDFFALVASGDSMMPYIHQGDLCIMNSSTDKVNLMPVCAMCEGDDSPCVKELVYSNGDWLLRSWNLSYSDRVIRPVDIINGHLVGIISADDKLQIGPDLQGLTLAKLKERFDSRRF